MLFSCNGPFFDTKEAFIGKNMIFFDNFFFFFELLREKINFKK
jgi:hypothetical protein